MFNVKLQITYYFRVIPFVHFLGTNSKLDEHLNISLGGFLKFDIINLHKGSIFS